MNPKIFLVALLRLTAALTLQPIGSFAQKEPPYLRDRGPGIQWHCNRNVFLKANTGFGVTSKATDFAPEVGIMFSIK